MAAVTICSDFGAPKNKVWHCFYCFPIYFPWSDVPLKKNMGNMNYNMLEGKALGFPGGSDDKESTWVRSLG